MLVEDGKVPDADNPAHDWVAPAVRATTDMRAAEIAAVVSGHIRHMGFSARAHIRGHEIVDAQRLAILAGLGVRDGERIRNPFVDNFSIAVIATSYELATDQPLHATALRAKGWHYWWGINGAQSGRERNRRAARPSHYSRYPMETVRQVDRPTTLIIDDEGPRVPKRAAFFERALQGDLGPRAQKERSRFSFKHPTSQSLLKTIRSLVPYQDGDVADKADADGCGDPAANARAVKALSYFLGSDLTGICEVPRYAWHSHKEDGRPIEMYHRYAVVMLIDQGFDTMEGASGDDWISGTQSMRGYLRGAEIAGIMSELLRGFGYSSRAQTNADSDVLHIPLILWAGLGELSPIGGLVSETLDGEAFRHACPHTCSTHCPCPCIAVCPPIYWVVQPPGAGVGLGIWLVVGSSWPRGARVEGAVAYRIASRGSTELGPSRVVERRRPRRFLGNRYGRLPVGVSPLDGVVADNCRTGRDRRTPGRGVLRSVPFTFDTDGRVPVRNDRIVR